SLVDGADPVFDIPGIGTSNGTSNSIRTGMIVQKIGAASGHTTAKVLDPDFVIDLQYVAPDGTVGRVGFRDQVMCEPFTRTGDSGSLVLNSKDEVVGLHFAGSPTMSVFNRIGNVFDAL